jgi:hypothetical protein
MDAKFSLRHICTITFFFFQAIFAHLASKLAKSDNMTSPKNFNADFKCIEKVVKGLPENS